MRKIKKKILTFSVLSFEGQAGDAWEPHYKRRSFFLPTVSQNDNIEVILSYQGWVVNEVFIYKLVTSSTITNDL
jgi:hypothetical protein